jgi:hypothetical protein
LKSALGEPCSFGYTIPEGPWESVWEYRNILFFFDEGYYVESIAELDPRDRQTVLNVLRN